MADVVMLQFLRWIDAARLAGRILKPPKKPLIEGETSASVSVDAKQASELVRVVARRSAGLVAANDHTEVVWADGDRELAVDLANLQIKTADGEIHFVIPVRCDQTGPAVVEVIFAVGTKDEPSGLYASTYRRPNGPALIVGAWGEPLVAFAWQCLLGLVGGIAAAVGKDEVGNALVPVELTASKRDGLEIVPMAMHQLTGSPPRKGTP